MTFEEFRAMAINPPRRDMETIFEVIEYDVKELAGRKRSHYPKFDVRHFCVGYGKSLTEAEKIMKEAIAYAGKYDTEIYCFHIKEFPIGEYISFNWEGYGVSWRLYDSTGRFLDKTYCSDLERDHNTTFGRYRGRPEESFRFKEGDIVEVLDGDEVRLAIATSAPLTVEWYWELRERIRKRKGLIWEYEEDKELTDEEVEAAYFPDSGDDQIPVIDGPSYSTHDHVHILNIMPLRYPLSAKLRKKYEGYYRAMLKEEREN